MEVGEFNSDTIPEFQFESFDTNSKKMSEILYFNEMMLLLRDLLMDFLTLLIEQITYLFSCYHEK